MWAAVGGLAGYYGFQEQQALRAALLQRQQELEQSEWLHDCPLVSRCGVVSPYYQHSVAC